MTAGSRSRSRVWRRSLQLLAATIGVTALLVEVGRAADLTQELRSAEEMEFARTWVGTFECLERELAELAPAVYYPDPDTSDNPVLDDMWFQRMIELGFPEVRFTLDRQDADGVLRIEPSAAANACNGWGLEVVDP